MPPKTPPKAPKQPPAQPPPAHEAPGAPPQPLSRAALFLLFLKLGSTAFGGFMTLISIIQHELVERRRVLAHEHLANGISLAAMLPGPVAVNVAAYAGFRLHGLSGALIALVAVVLPSFVLMVLAAEIYHRWLAEDLVRDVLRGLLPAIVAIILQAGWGVGRKAVTDAPTAVIGIVAAAMIGLVSGYYVTVAAILGSGVAGWLLFRRRPPPPGPAHAAATLSFGLRLGLAAFLVVSFVPFLLPDLFADTRAQIWATFSGMSLTLFGGGYVFVPLIQKVVVEARQWIGVDEFALAIAAGQATPGPIMTSATFIGYRVAGLAGATAATIGIFVPPAMLIVLASHWVGRFENLPSVRAALRGTRAGVTGMIFAAAATVASIAQLRWFGATILALSLLALLRFKLSPVWLILIAAAAGVLSGHVPLPD